MSRAVRPIVGLAENQRLLTDHGLLAVSELKRGVQIYSCDPVIGAAVGWSKISKKGIPTSVSELVSIRLQGGFTVLLAPNQMVWRIDKGSYILTRAIDIAAGDTVWRDMPQASNEVQTVSIVPGATVTPVEIVGGSVGVYTESRMLIQAGSLKGVVQL